MQRDNEIKEILSRMQARYQIRRAKQDIKDLFREINERRKTIKRCEKFLKTFKK